MAESPEDEESDGRGQRRPAASSPAELCGVEWPELGWAGWAGQGRAGLGVKSERGARGRPPTDRPARDAQANEQVARWKVSGTLILMGGAAARRTGRAGGADDAARRAAPAPS